MEHKLRTIVTLPTFNEAHNIKPLINKLRELGLEVLVADDNSPDGTWKIVKEITESDPKVYLLHRMEKKGSVCAEGAWDRSFYTGAMRQRTIPTSPWDLS